MLNIFEHMLNMFNICGPNMFLTCFVDIFPVLQNLILNRIQNHQQILSKTMSVSMVRIKHNIKKYGD